MPSCPALLIRGRLQNQHGVINVVAERIDLLPVAAPTKSRDSGSGAEQISGAVGEAQQLKWQTGDAPAFEDVAADVDAPCHMTGPR